MGTRRAARELALQYLFSHEFQQTQMSASQWLAQYAEDFELTDEVAKFAQDLCNGVVEHKSKIDPVIQSHSAHWKISRMSLVDINILRVAVFEMHFSPRTLEPKIIMNEAIDIAKIYGSVDSGAFVNGIIDQIAKSLHK